MSACSVYMAGAKRLHAYCDSHSRSREREICQEVGDIHTLTMYVWRNKVRKDGNFMIGMFSSNMIGSNNSRGKNETFLGGTVNYICG